MAEATFEPAPGVKRVILAVQGHDELIVVDGTYRTDDRRVVAALDRHPGVVRAAVRRTYTAPAGRARR